MHTIFFFFKSNEPPEALVMLHLFIGLIRRKQDKRVQDKMINIFSKVFLLLLLFYSYIKQMIQQSLTLKPYNHI